MCSKCLSNSNSSVYVLKKKHSFAPVVLNQFPICFIKACSPDATCIIGFFCTIILKLKKIFISYLRNSMACHNYHNFSSRHSMLAEILFNQGFSVRKLMRTFYKFMGRYPELASKFNKSPSSVICDSVLMAQLYHTFSQLMK